MVESERSRETIVIDTYALLAMAFGELSGITVKALIQEKYKNVSKRKNIVV